MQPDTTILDSYPTNCLPPDIVSIQDESQETSPEQISSIYCDDLIYKILAKYKIMVMLMARHRESLTADRNRNTELEFKEAGKKAETIVNPAEYVYEMAGIISDLCSGILQPKVDIFKLASQGSNFGKKISSDDARIKQELCDRLIRVIDTYNSTLSQRSGEEGPALKDMLRTIDDLWAKISNLNQEIIQSIRK